MTKPTRLLLALLTAVTAALGFAACGDDRVEPAGTEATAGATVPAPPVEVLVYRVSGGCEVLGPNCPTYTVWSDGSVDISRTGVPGKPEITGHIPAAHVSAWLAGIADLDPAALADEVGPGSCNSCVDGVDVQLTITRSGGVIRLDSVTIAFDTTNEFFAGLDSLMSEVRSVGEITMVER